MADTLNLSKEIIFSSSDSNISRKISLAEKAGKLKKIAPRVYTTNMLDSAESVVKRNLIDILAWRYPNAVISHRSAQELRPTDDGEFFLTYNFRKKISDLPGITLNINEGLKAIEGDILLNGIFIASEYRWMLECMQISKRKGKQSKVLPISFIESRLEKMILIQGEEKLNEFRDKLREVSVLLNMPVEFEKLNRIISALMSTHNVNVLTNDSSRARAAGEPFDAARIELFSILFETLKDYFFIERTNKNTDEVLMRIGRAQENYPSIQRHYQIDIQKDDNDQVTQMQWSIKDEPQIDANAGIYFLRTSIERLDEKTTWEYYNLIREIENTFRTLKTDLDLRPIFHQKDESSEAHLFLGLLAYWLVNTIRYQLKKQGIKHHWTEITRIMSTQKVVTTTAENKLGETIAFRNCTTPQTKVAEIYDALKYKHQPFKRRKICSTQTHPPDSILGCLAMSSA